MARRRLARLTRRRTIAGLVFFLGFVLSSADAWANACASNVASGNWSVAGSWTTCGGTTPQSADTVTILNTHVITLDASPTIQSININNGGTLSADASSRVLTLTATTGTLFTLGATGTFTPNNSEVIFSPDASVTLTSGTVTFNKLTLGPTITANRTYTFGSGVITCNNDFYIFALKPGAPVRSLTVNMGANITATGVLTVSGDALGNATVTLNTTTSNRNLTAQQILVATAATLTANNSQITITSTAADVDAFQESGGTFNYNTSTVIYAAASGTANIVANKSGTAGTNGYYNLHIKPIGTATYKLGSDVSQTIAVNNDLVIGDGANAVTVDWETNDPALTVKGNLTLNNLSTWTKSSTATLTRSPTGTKTWTDSNSTKQNMGAVSITGGASTPTIQLGSDVKVTTLSIAASHTVNPNSNKCTITNTGTPLTNSGTISNSGTIEYTGNGATTITATTYPTLRINGGSGITHSITTGTITANGGLYVDSGIFDIGGATTTFAATTVASGAELKHSSTTGTKTFTGLVTISSGGTWNNSGNEAITMRGGLTHNGTTFTAGSGVYTFDTGSPQTIGGSSSITMTSCTITSILLFNTGTLTTTTLTMGGNNTLVVNNGTWTLTTLNDSTANAMFVQGVNSTLTIAGSTFQVQAFGAGSLGNTVIYSSSSAQTVRGTSYHHLTINGGQTATLGSKTVVGGDLNVSNNSTLSTSGSNYDLTVGQDFIVASGSTFTAGSGTVYLDPTQSGTITMNGSTFNNLTMADPGVVNAYWKMDEASGNLFDSSGNGNTATPTGATPYTASLPPLNFTNPRAYDYSGSAQYLTVSNSTTVNLGGTDMTLSMWINPDTIVDTTYYALYEKSPASRDYAAWMVGTGTNVSSQIFTCFGGNQAGVGWLILNTNITTGSWQHLVIMRSGTNALVFLNGVNVGVHELTLSATNTGSLFIADDGADTGGTPLDGKYDDFRIYNRALTNNEIAILSAGDDLVTASATGVKTLGSDITMNGNLTINAGTLDVSTNNYTVSVRGSNWTRGANGTFNPRSGTVVFDGGATSCTLNAGLGTTHTFHNVQIGSATAGGGLVAKSLFITLDVNGALTVGSAASTTLDISNDTTVKFAGDVNLTNLDTFTVFTLSGSTVQFDGTTNLTSAGKSFYSVQIGTASAGGSLTTMDTMDINGVFTVGSVGTTVFDISGDTVKFGEAANFTNLDTFTVTGSTCEFDKASTTQVFTPVTALPLNNLSHTGAGTLQLATNNLDVNGTVTNSAGTLDANGRSINVAGDWNNTAAFTAGTGTVTFDGGTQTIRGNNTWYGLAVTGTAARTVNFESTKTQTIVSGGSLTFTGASGQLLTLAPLTAATAWLLNCNAAATQSVTYVTPTYSDASSGATINASDGTSVDGTPAGTNTNWNFGSGAADTSGSFLTVF